MKQQHDEVCAETPAPPSDIQENPATATEPTASDSNENHVDTPRPNHAEITQENIKSALHEIISEIDREMEGDFNEEVQPTTFPIKEQRMQW